MAYNPFNIFRRNQRAIFAVVTVFIMFTFVLSSGLGGNADFFDWFPQWLRGKSKKGEVLCTIDGTKIYSRDADRLKLQRTMANRFLAVASTQSLQNMFTNLRELRAQATPAVVQRLDQAMQFEQFAPGGLERLMDQIAEDPKSKQADKEIVQLMRAQGLLAMAQDRFSRSGSYLTMTSNRTSRDEVEFMLWDRKAKELGIVFAEDDVRKLIDREFMGLFKSYPAAFKQVKDEMQGFTQDACMTALAAEFRVRAAQTALLGPTSALRGDHTLSAAPTFTPAYEMFDFYRDQTSGTNYEVLAVPAAAFVNRVTETPSDDELLRLFNERKDYEPDPSRAEPGFKEPRKVKVEWVSVTGEEPYYQKLAAEQLAKGPVAAAIIPPTLSSLGTLVIAPIAATDPLISQRYKTSVKDRHETRLRLNWDGTSSFILPSDVLDPSILRAQNLAAAAGGGAGLAAGFGGPLPASLLAGATIAAEQKARVKTCVPLLLGAIPGPGMLATAVGGEVAFRKNLPEPLPLEVYRPELVKELTEQKARELAIADLNKLKEEVDKLTENGRAKDKSGARAHIAEFIKTRGVKTGGTTDFQSEWTIADDPGMAPLKDVLDKAKASEDPHAAMMGQSQPVQFGQRFFWTTAGFGAPRAEAIGTYKPEFYPERAGETSLLSGKKDPVFLAWRTDEKKPENLSFTRARPLVVEAWKRAKARDLAKAEAERLAAELRAKPSTSAVSINQDLKDMQAALEAQTPDPKAKKKVRVFGIDDVAPYQIAMGGMGFQQGRSVRAFRVNASESIPYPTPEMTKVLLEDRTKPPRTVEVLPDQPRDTYYVFALADRVVKTPEAYAMDMAETGFMPNQVRDQVRMLQTIEARKRARESVLALLKQEFNYVETDEQKKLLDDREKRTED